MVTVLKYPKIYDAMYSVIIDDINFYRTLVKPYDEIVEYGAGTGRISIPLSMEGHRIVAIDNEPEMLNELYWLPLKIQNSLLNVTINSLLELIPFLDIHTLALSSDFVQFLPILGAVILCH